MESDAPGTFTIEHTIGDGVVRISVAGELDAHTAPSVTDAVRDAIAHNAPALDLELEMSGVTFIDSTGLRAVLMAREEVTEAGGRFALAQPNPVVSRLLELANLTDAFVVH